MKQSPKLYNLYCMNMQCKVSIYHRMTEQCTPLTAENLTGKHFCTCCNQSLASAIDLEIKQTMAVVNSQEMKPSYLNN
jgi:hypothetical protein